MRRELSRKRENGEHMHRRGKSRYEIWMPRPSAEISTEASLRGSKVGGPSWLSYVMAVVWLSHNREWGGGLVVE